MTYNEKYAYVANCITNGSANGYEYDIAAIVDDLSAYDDLDQVPYDEFWEVVAAHEYC